MLLWPLLDATLSVPAGTEFSDLCGTFAFGPYVICIGWGEYSHTGDGDDAERCYRAEAWRGNERVGSIRFEDQGNGRFTSENMWVLDTHQRRGLATAMMDAVERTEAIEVQSSGDTTSDAKAFWLHRISVRGATVARS